MCVAQHLNFNVPGLFHKLFNEHAVVAETVAGLIATRGEAFMGFFVVERHTQALAPTAGRGFDHHRVTDGLGNLHRFLGAFYGLVVPGYGVDLGLLSQFFGCNFVAHGCDGMVLGSDKNQAFFFASFGERFVLTQESIPWVNGLRAG